MARPKDSIKWPHTRGVDINIQKDDIIPETSAVDSRGYPKYRSRLHKNKKCTIIFGCKEMIMNCEKENVITLLENDKVYTCWFNGIGHISSLGTENENKEITIIIHNITKTYFESKL